MLLKTQTQARRILGDRYDVASKTEAQLRLDVVQSCLGDLAGKSDAYVAAAFDLITAGTVSPPDFRADAGTGTARGALRFDSLDDPASSNAARDRATAAYDHQKWSLGERWKAPEMHAPGMSYDENKTYLQHRWRGHEQAMAEVNRMKRAA